MVPMLLVPLYCLSHARKDCRSALLPLARFCHSLKPLKRFIKMVFCVQSKLCRVCQSIVESRSRLSTTKPRRTRFCTLLAFSAMTKQRRCSVRSETSLKRLTLMAGEIALDSHAIACWIDVNNPCCPKLKINTFRFLTH